MRFKKKKNVKEEEKEKRKAIRKDKEKNKKNFSCYPDLQIQKKTRKISKYIPQNRVKKRKHKNRQQIYN